MASNVCITAMLRNCEIPGLAQAKDPALSRPCIGPPRKDPVAIAQPWSQGSQCLFAEPVNPQRMLVANEHQSGEVGRRSCIGLDHSWYR